MKYEDVNPDRLYLGSRCKNYDHHQSDGHNVRYKKGGCLACTKNLPPGLIEYTFIGLEVKLPKVKYHTQEEKRHARVQQQMRWNSRNKEKVLGYLKTYNEKPSRVEINKIKAAERFANLSPDQRQILYARQKAWRDRNKEKIAAYNALMKEQDEHSRS